VDRANDRLVLAVERLQPGADIVPELLGDDPVECDHEDIVPVNA
jgi:hypothetical protein